MGIKPQWYNNPPPVTGTPTSNYASDTLNKEKAKLIEDMISKGLKKESIRIVHDPVSDPGTYSRIFLIPKKGSVHKRPIIDLSYVNTFSIVPHFKMETSQIIRNSLTDRDWVTSIDLKDAYYHLPLHRSCTRYCRFLYKGVHYEYLATPFGLAIAPMEFTEIVRNFKYVAVQLGFRINQYLDDWINRALTKQDCGTSNIRLLALTIYLGFIPNLDKCEFIPSQFFDFIGIHYRLPENKVSLTQDRMNSIQSKAQSFLSNRYTYS